MAAQLRTCEDCNLSVPPAQYNDHLVECHRVKRVIYTCQFCDHIEVRDLWMANHMLQIHQQSIPTCVIRCYSQLPVLPFTRVLFCQYCHFKHYEQEEMSRHVNKCHPH